LQLQFIEYFFCFIDLIYKHFYTFIYYKFHWLFPIYICYTLDFTIAYWY